MSDQSTRRTFLKHAGAVSFSVGMQEIASSAVALTGWPRRRPNRIKKLIRRDETIVRSGVLGYGFAMTWAADGRQFLSILDGGVDISKPVKKALHSRVFTVSGEPWNPIFEDVAGYPDMLIKMKEPDFATFWGSGCLALDECVYQFLTTGNHPYLRPDGSFWPDFYWVGAKLLYSPDNGRTWQNQDGSSPVLWEKWDARSRENMVFFNEEPEGAFAWPSFLQMGRNYGLNRDGFVYVYSPNGHADGTMNQLVMYRVPILQILDRHSYEFFSGVRSDGSADWTRDISARGVVHTFPRGWVNKYVPGESPWAWVPSVTYNAPLGLYMMTSWGTSCTPEGGWFGKPSYLGFWVAPAPWGPFTQVHEELAWTPGNDRAARAFMPQIAPKWISADGKSFWLVWSDYQYQGTAGEVENPDQDGAQELKSITDDAEFARAFAAWARKHMPYASFNSQRVDLILE